MDADEARRRSESLHRNLLQATDNIEGTFSSFFVIFMDMSRQFWQDDLLKLQSNRDLLVELQRTHVKLKLGRYPAIWFCRFYVGEGESPCGPEGN